VTVADYRCQTLTAATAEILGDDLVVGTVTPQPGGYPGGPDAIVIEQNPTPGKKVNPGSAVDLVVYDPASLATCPP
jgi:beta-lactam-binding protein with PASTA domain